MKVISFNINGVRARPHQIEKLIELHNPDVIGLQETKVDDPQFPVKMIEDLGYQVSYFGQKSHYGVALMSKKKPLSVRKGLAPERAAAQRSLCGGAQQGSQ